MQNSLGKRVERLLFVGLILLALCFAEAYLTTVSSYFSNSNNGDDNSEILKIFKEKKVSRLQSLYEREKQSAENAQLTSEKLKALKIPGGNVGGNDTPYSDELRLIITEIISKPGINEEFVMQTIDFSKSPDEILESIDRNGKNTEDKPANIWGIETPRIFSVRYGGVNYKLEPEFLSRALGIVLTPALIGWFGSFYVTRQRELLLMAGNTSYFSAFPHILNLLPVVLKKIEQINQDFTRKRISKQRRSNRIWMAVFRSLIILVYTTPMLFLFSSSMLNIIQGNYFGIYWIISGSVTAIILAIIILFLVFQEIFILNGKDFYEK